MTIKMCSGNSDGWHVKSKSFECGNTFDSGILIGIELTRTLTLAKQPNLGKRETEEKDFSKIFKVNILVRKVEIKGKLLKVYFGNETQKLYWANEGQ